MNTLIKDISQNKSFGKTLRVFEVPSSMIDTLHKEGRMITPKEMEVYPNQPLVLKSGQQSVLAIVGRNNKELLKAHTDIEWFGIRGRNKEQFLLQNLLDDPEIRCLVITGSAGTGKAQPLYSKILTKDGWVEMEDIELGMMVATPDGSFSPVTGVFPQGEKDIYRVHFKDGSYTDCCDEHLWYTKTESQHHTNSTGSVKSLREIKKTLKTPRGRNNHFIPMSNPIDFDKKDFDVDPYLMGILLGDGCFTKDNLRISSGDDFILDECENSLSKIGCSLRYLDKYDYSIVTENSKSGRFPIYRFKSEDIKTGKVKSYADISEIREDGYSKHVHEACRKDLIYDGKTWERFDDLDTFSTNKVRNFLMECGLYGKRSEEKFIPSEYLCGSAHQRLRLLQGLMDADGSIDYRNGCNVHLSTTSKHLVDDVTQLVQSLGGIVSVREKQSYYKYKGERREGKLSFVVNIRMSPDLNPFLLPRKADVVTPKSKYVPSRSIEKIEYIGEKEAQCIKIDHPDHLYITDDYIVTHNTTVVGSYALDQVLDKENMEKLILSKPLEIVTRSRYWGTMPGDENDKFAPFLKSYKILFENMVGKDGGKYIDVMIEDEKIEFMPLELMRGASLRECICWYDEAQNLNHFETLTLGSRLDDTGGSKLILSGDLAQRDRNIKRQRTGLHKLVTNPYFLNSPHTAHIELIQNERGVVSQLFHDVFDDDPRKD